MTDKKAEELHRSGDSPQTGEQARKSGVIADKENQGEHAVAHKKKHSQDKRPSELQLPAVQSFGIVGDVSANDRGKGKATPSSDVKKTPPSEVKKVADASWTAETGKEEWRSPFQPDRCSDQEKAVLARRHFIKELEEHDKDPAHREKVIASMHKLEERLQSNPKELKAFYEQVSRLSETGITRLGSHPVADAGRMKLAEQIVLQAANPDLIRQGDHNTCNVATVEYRLYSRHPAAAAKLITDMALDGSSQSGGVKIDVSGTLYPGVYKPEHGTDGLDFKDKRSFASQIFQIGAVNMHYAADDHRLTYVEGARLGADDRDEGVYAASGERDGRKPGLSDDNLVEIYNRLSGEKTSNFVALHKSEDASSKNCKVFENIAELKKYLSESTAQMPLILKVHTVNEPFFSDAPSGDKIGGAHVITIRSYDAVKNTVSIHNQWSENCDHNAVPLAVIFNSTRGPGTNLAELQAGSGRHELLSLSDQLDMARLKLVYEPQNDGPRVLANDLIACMKKAKERFQHEHTSKAEQDRIWLKYERILEMLSQEVGGEELQKRVQHEVRR